MFSTKHLRGVAVSCGFKFGINERARNASGSFPCAMNNQLRPGANIGESGCSGESKPCDRLKGC